MFAKGRRIAAIGRKHGKAKLTEAKVNLIRCRYADGKGSTRSLGKQIGISYVTVRSVLVGRQWKWLPCPPGTAVKIKQRLLENNAWSFGQKERKK